MLGIAAFLASAGLGGKTCYSCSTDSIVFVAIRSSVCTVVSANGSIKIAGL